MQDYKKLVYVLFLVLLCGCDSSINLREKYEKWIGKEILFPDNIMPVLFDNECNFVEVDNLENNSHKLFVFVGKEKCYRCELKFHSWNSFLADIMSKTGKSIDLLMYVQPKEVQVVYDIAKDERFSGLLFVDINGEIDSLNHFEQDGKFRCFLLDENNRVVLIGNPVQNPKIKDLYIRTICEKLGIENVSKMDEKPRVNFGTFSKDESKTAQFIIKNSDKDFLIIDSVYTSCECTTATISKPEINKNESTVLTVTYTPDEVGEFYREIYVKINGEDKPRVFAIEGKTE